MTTRLLTLDWKLFQKLNVEKSFRDENKPCQMCEEERKKIRDDDNLVKWKRKNEEDNKPWWQEDPRYRHHKHLFLLLLSRRKQNSHWSNVSYRTFCRIKTYEQQEFAGFWYTHKNMRMQSTFERIGREASLRTREAWPPDLFAPQPAMKPTLEFRFCSGEQNPKRIVPNFVWEKKLTNVCLGT